MTRFIAILCAGAVMLLSSCSTIVFHSGQPASTEQHYFLHHNVMNSQVELSAPILPSRYCSTGWSQIQVEKDLLTQLLGSLEPDSEYDRWDPWAVTVLCAQEL